MVFKEWEKVPVAERRHRTVLYLANKELERRALEDARDAQFAEEMEHAASMEARSH